MLTPAEIHGALTTHTTDEASFFADDICHPHALYDAGLSAVVHLRTGTVSVSGAFRYGKGGGCLSNGSDFDDSLEVARRVKGAQALWELAGLGVYAHTRTPRSYDYRFRTAHCTILEFVNDRYGGPWWTIYNGPLREWLIHALGGV